MSPKIKLDDSVLNSLSLFLKTQFGLSFPKEKYPDLERGLNSIMAMMHEKDPVSCIQQLTTLPLSKSQIEKLTAHFTVGETYFFRETAYFDVLKNSILPSIIEEKRRNGKIIRIWSAGCSSGEEPYSIAILLSQLIGDIQNWNITILATDINLNSLHKLKTGIYSEWSFRGVESTIKDKYFNKTNDNNYEIKPIFKKMLTANYFNLAQDLYPSLVNNSNAMDIIFCRNLLMYFEPTLINNIVTHFKMALVEGGYLIVGSSEHFLIHPHSFSEYKKQDAIFYQKTISIDDHDNGLNTYYDINSTMQDKRGTQDARDAQGAQDTQGINDAGNTQDTTDTQNTNELMTATNARNDSSFNTREHKADQRALSNIKPAALKKMESSTKNSESTTAKTANKNTQEKIIEIELLAKSLANEGKLNEALEVINNGLKLDKCNILLHYLKALVLQELGLFDEAILELKKTIYLDNNFILAYFSLGNIATRQQQLESAKKYYSTVLSLSHQYAPTDQLPGSEGGITAERMREIINSKKLI